MAGKDKVREAFENLATEIDTRIKNVERRTVILRWFKIYETNRQIRRLRKELRMTQIMLVIAVIVGWLL